jgi:hypothetical protein
MNTATKPAAGVLPELPSPVYHRSDTFSGARLYSESQMREYGRSVEAKVAATLREATPVDPAELWAVAQLAPGEGIKDAIARIERLVADHVASVDPAGSGYSGLTLELGGWISHASNDQPVSDGTVVVVRYRDGSFDGPDFAESWQWPAFGAQNDVVAYKIAA